MNRIVVMTADSAAGDEKAGFSIQSIHFEGESGSI